MFEKIESSFGFWNLLTSDGEICMLVTTKENCYEVIKVILRYCILNFGKECNQETGNGFWGRVVGVFCVIFRG